MKKIAFIIALLCMGLAQADAQSIKAGRYKGFGDMSFIFGNDGVFTGCNAIGFGTSTSHGYQVNQHIFVGGGLGIYYHSMDYMGNEVAVPIFANVRANLLKGRISPFVDLKLGYSPSNVRGVYFAPNFGVRYGLQGNMGLNFHIGYSMQGYDYVLYGPVFDYEDNALIHSMNITVGLDW